MVLTITGPLLTEISSAFSLNLAQSGFLFAANFIGFSIFIVIGGIAADHWGKRKVMSVSLVGLALSLFAFPLSPSFYTACFISLFTGGFCGIVESLTNALVVDLNPENCSFHVNITQIFFGIGALVGPIMAGILVSSGISWRQCYYIIGGLLALSAIIFIANKLPPLPKPEKINMTAFRNLVTDWKFLLICLCMVFYTGSEVGGWGWMSTFLKKNMDFPISKSSLAVSIFWLVVTIGRLICSPLTLRYSARFLAIVLALFSVVVTILSGLVGSEFAVWAVIVAMGLAYSSQWALIVAYGSSIYKKYSGTVFALLVGSGGVGMAVVPFLMGIIGEYINMRIAMISPALLFLMVALIFVNIEKIKPKEVNI